MGTNEKLNPQDLMRLEKLRYMDDDFMTACFDGNIEAVELVLRVILDRNDLVIQTLTVQRVMKNLQGRSAVLDVHVIDSEGKEYDIEIQRSDTGAGAKRARHNSSLLDAHTLKPGEDAESIPETYVIFITEKDLLKKGKSIYQIDRYIHMDDKKVLFGDGSHILYVNGEYQGDDNIGKLMHDFSCTDPDDMNFEELAKKARYFKKDKEGQKIMCKMMEDMRKEALKAGMIEVAVRMLETGTYSLDEIARISGLKMEEIKNLKVSVVV